MLPSCADPDALPGIFFNHNSIYEMATKEKKPKKEKFVEPHFKDMVEVWFNFCRQKFNEPPTFDGSAPRDLKSILKALRERCELSGIEWSLDNAQRRFQNFLEFAWQEWWLQKNWLLFNINRQKDKIFFNIRATIKRQPTDPFE